MPSAAGLPLQRVFLRAAAHQQQRAGRETAARGGRGRRAGDRAPRSRRTIRRIRAPSCRRGPAIAAAPRRAAAPIRNASMSTAFGMTVTFSAGMPRATISPRSPFADRRDVVGAAQRDASPASATPGSAGCPPGWCRGPRPRPPRARAARRRPGYPAGAPLCSAGSAFRTGECACRMSGSNQAHDARRCAAPSTVINCSSPIAGVRDRAPLRMGVRWKCQPSDRLLRRLRRVVLGRGELQRLPAERALLAQDRERAERVAAVQRQRVVEDVQDAQGSSDCLAPAARRAAARDDVQTQEGVEHQQRPERRAVVARAGLDATRERA